MSDSPEFGLFDKSAETDITSRYGKSVSRSSVSVTQPDAVNVSIAGLGISR